MVFNFCAHVGSDNTMALWTWSRYVRKGMFVEVGKGDVSPSFGQVLELLLAKGEYLAFAPDTKETRMMINLMSIKFPLLKVLLFISFFFLSLWWASFSSLLLDELVRDSFRTLSWSRINAYHSLIVFLDKYFQKFFYFVYS